MITSTFDDKTRDSRQDTMPFSPMPNAMKPDFQRVQTQWNQGFIAFGRLRNRPIVMLMVLE